MFSLSQQLRDDAAGSRTKTRFSVFKIGNSCDRPCVIKERSELCVSEYTELLFDYRPNRFIYQRMFSSLCLARAIEIKKRITFVEKYSQKSVISCLVRNKHDS